MTSVFFRDHPEFVGIARDEAGVTGGYYVAVSPANAPAAAERDVLLGPWPQYCRETLGSNSVVLAREAVDLTGERGEVTAPSGLEESWGQVVSTRGSCSCRSPRHCRWPRRSARHSAGSTFRRSTCALTA